MSQKCGVRNVRELAALVGLGDYLSHRSSYHHQDGSLSKKGTQVKIAFSLDDPEKSRRVTFVEGGKSLAMEAIVPVAFGVEEIRGEWREVNHVTRGEWFEIDPTPEEVFEFAREVLADEERWSEVNALLREGLA